MARREQCSAGERQIVQDAERRQERREAFTILAEAATEKMRNVDQGQVWGMVEGELDGRPIGGYLKLKRVGGTLDLHYRNIDKAEYTIVMPVDRLGTEADYHEDVPLEIMRQAAHLVPELDEDAIGPLPPNDVE